MVDTVDEVLKMSVFGAVLVHLEVVCLVFRSPSKMAAVQETDLAVGAVHETGVKAERGIFIIGF